MKFNAVWTKDKNNQLRQMIRENRTVSEIKDFFADDIKYHPKKKYSHNYLIPYFKYLKEIKINPIKIEYNIKRTYSIIYENKYDYIINFDANKNNYVIILLYYLIADKETYNVIFTTKEQYVEYLNYLNELSKKSSNISEIEHIRLATILEEETNLNEIYTIMEYISYILFSFYPNINGKSLSIGETDNLTKIRLYRNIIKDSFDNIKEEQIVDNGKKIYLYEIK